ncbi:MAG: ATP-binding protein, partial [Deltaproteobacteria bacterium]|nr:ATP-binding protein [Deltaproteobacteria bacterium]
MDKEVLDKVLPAKPEGAKTIIKEPSAPTKLIYVDINRRMRVPKVYLPAKFSDLKGIDKWIAHAKEAIDASKSLTLTGDPGTGKTHLAICLMRYNWARTQPPLHEAPLFVSMPDLFFTLKSSFKSDDTSEEDIINYYTRPSLVVFDDLGVGNTSDWARGIFYALIDRRIREEKQ